MHIDSHRLSIPDISIRRQHSDAIDKSEAQPKVPAFNAKCEGFDSACTLYRCEPALVSRMHVGTWDCSKHHRSLHQL